MASRNDLRKLIIELIDDGMRVLDDDDYKSDDASGLLDEYDAAVADPEPDATPRPHTLEHRLEYEQAWDERVEAGWAKDGKPRDNGYVDRPVRPSIIRTRRGPG